MPLTLNRRDVMSRVTMNVRISGMATHKLRLAIGVKLIRLAAAVIGIGIVVETESARPPADLQPPPVRPQASRDPGAY
jgi:hypothetical protein